LELAALFSYREEDGAEELGMFSSRKFLGNATVVILLLFDKYYPIMD
jgi:hypothetical protein